MKLTPNDPARELSPPIAPVLPARHVEGVGMPQGLVAQSEPVQPIIVAASVATINLALDAIGVRSAEIEVASDAADRSVIQAIKIVLRTREADDALRAELTRRGVKALA